MMTTNLFVIANVKQLRTDGSFIILLPFFRTSWCVGVLNSTIFNSFHNRVVWHDFGGPSEFREEGLNPPQPSHPTSSVRHWRTSPSRRPIKKTDCLQRDSWLIRLVFKWFQFRTLFWNGVMCVWVVRDKSNAWCIFKVVARRLSDEMVASNQSRSLSCASFCGERCVCDVVGDHSIRRASPSALSGCNHCRRTPISFSSKSA